MWQLPPLTPEEIIDYLRKSRTDDPTLSVEEVLAKHEQMLDEWDDRHLAGRVPEENRYREIVSGETIDSRPEIQKVLKRIESPRIKAIKIVEPQRLSRGDLEDIGRLVKLLRYSNTIVITPSYNYDLRDERDRDAFERELKRGNEYLEYTKKIMYNGRLLSVENGNYIGTWPPYGYKKVMYKDGKRKCFTLEPIPEEARIVKLIFEMYRDGYGSHRIARHLNEMGVKTSKGGKWAAESLKKMRTNEHYLGKVVWNRRREVKTIEDGEVVTSRPLHNDYLVFPGKHEAIIDQQLWDDVQEIRNKIPPVKRRQKCTNPFAGLVFCQCGRIMPRRTYMRNGIEKTPPRLLCDNQVYCGTASCFVSEMEEAVIKWLEENIEEFEEKLKASHNDVLEEHQRLIEQQEKRLEELNKLEISQWDKYTQEGMPKHIFDQLNAKVLAEKEEVKQGLCLMRSSMPEPVDYERRIVMFSDALEALKNPEAPALEKNLLLKDCIERIDYSRKKKAGTCRRWGEPEPMKLLITPRFKK